MQVLTIWPARIAAGVVLACSWHCTPAQAEGDFPISGSIGVGVQYDSNVSVDEADLNLRRGDASALLSAAFITDIVNSKKTRLRFGYSFDQIVNEDISELDLQIHTATASASHRIGNLQIGLDYQYNHVRLDGDSYLDIHLLSPSASMFVTKNLYLRAAYLHQEKNFATVDSLDAGTDLVTIDAYRFFKHRNGYIALGLRGDDEDAKGAEFRYRARQASIRAQIPIRLFGTDIKARLGLIQSERRYRNETPRIGAKRRESRLTLSAALEIALTKHLSLRPQLRYVDRSSNVPIYDYREHVASTVLAFKF